MVTWTSPQTDVSISQYQVHYRRSGNSWSSAAPVSGSTTSTYLEELVAGSEYQIRMRAVSATGNGVWSEVQSETTYRSEFGLLGSACTNSRTIITVFIVCNALFHFV